MKKGVITVYMSCVLMVMLSLIFTLIEGARINGLRMQIECAMDISMQSIFAEYHRELLEQYDLFFIDSSYGSDNFSIHNTEEHLRKYLTYNVKLEKNIGLSRGIDLYGLSVQTVTITRESAAADEQGDVLKRQAIAYIKNKYGLDILEGVKENIKKSEENNIFTRDITSERNQNQTVIDNTEIPPKQTSEDEWEEVELENPADRVNQMHSMGILNMVIDDKNTLSNYSVDVSQYVSHREKHVGDGLDITMEKPSGKMDELLFGEYILEKFGNYCQVLDKALLKYQIEYILSGKSSDIENLKYVANKLLLCREAANVVYIYTDSAKVSQAKTLAAAIAAAVNMPILTEPIKHSLLFAWSFAESVIDVKTLLAGKRVPIMKRAEDWNLTLSQMLDFSGNAWEGKDCENGVSYEGYLRMFLALQNKEEKVYRCMDVIEMDIRQTPGNRQFRIDYCVDSIEAEVTFNSHFGYHYSIKREYAYYD